MEDHRSKQADKPTKRPETGPSRPSAYIRIRAQLESAIAHWAGICHDHAWWVILACLLVLLLIGSYLPKIQMDASAESYLHDDAPALRDYREFKSEFGIDERTVLLIDSGDTVLNDAFMRRLAELHAQLESIPQIDKVDSLINARLSIGQNDALVIRGLLDGWPEHKIDYAWLREQLNKRPLYRKHFVSADLRYTLIILTPHTYSLGSAADFDPLSFDWDEEPELVPLSLVEIQQMLAAVEAIAEQFESEGFQIGLGGSQYLTQATTQLMTIDMGVFTTVGMLLISLLLYVIFRRWVMVLLPVSIAGLSMLATFAVMAMVGLPINPSVQVIPSLLIAIGVGNSIHIFTAFFTAFDQGADKKAAMQHAYGHSGLAILLTNLTTMAGLFSFIAGEFKPVAEVGVIAPLGIACTLMLTFSLLPPLIALVRIHPPKQQAKAGRFQAIMDVCSDLAIRHARLVVGAWGVAIVLGVFLALQLQPSHYAMAWFPKDHEIRRVSDAIADNFGGANYTEVVVDSGQRNGLYSPDLLQAVDQALGFSATLQVNGIQAGASSSMLDIVKELHFTLNEENPAKYRIPDSAEIIAQELLLFENSSSDALAEMVTSDFAKARISIRMPDVDAVLYPDYLQQLHQGFRDRVGDQAELMFTGIVPLLVGALQVLISDTVRSYTIAFLAIAPLMMLFVGSVRLGLISMIPNLAPVVLTLALMAVLEIPLDAFTLMVGSIALGLAVDDTIHFMHNYLRFESESGDSDWAVRKTLSTTGRAMLITTIVLSCSFFIQMLGTMQAVRNFGFITGFCIIMALLADVLLAPAIMSLLAERRKRRQLQLARTDAQGPAA